MESHSDIIFPMSDTNESHLLLNRYQLLEQIGSGGAAEIYRARDLMLDRHVAIKVLREGFSNNPDFENQFRNEAHSAANLSHPNIVTVYDFGNDNWPALHRHGISPRHEFKIYASSARPLHG